ncbi:glycerol-3-phosphate dehydrogenase/oxidase, partial [Burkholderia cenocepacia]
MMFLPSRKPRTDRAGMTATEPLRVNRDEHLARLETDAFDVLIVGGGVTGA